VVKAVVKESLPMPVRRGKERRFGLRHVPTFCACLESSLQVRVAVNEVEAAMERSDIKLPFLGDEEGENEKKNKKDETKK
jgi:hypothetical protein